MKMERRIIREMLRQMPLPAAKEILEVNLLPDEFASIYLSRDVTGQKDLNLIADMLHTTESNVKKIRQRGYDRLATLYFHKKFNP